MEMLYEMEVHIFSILELSFLQHFYFVSRPADQSVGARVSPVKVSVRQAGGGVKDTEVNKADTVSSNRQNSLLWSLFCNDLDDILINLICSRQAIPLHYVIMSVTGNVLKFLLVTDLRRS